MSIMSAKSKAQFYRQLSQLVGSGFHLDKAVDLLLSQSPAADSRALLTAVQSGLATGSNLSSALEVHAKSITSPLERALVSTGERSGRLAEALDHLAAYFDTEDRSRSAARSALIYPIFLAHAGAAVPLLTEYLNAAIAGRTFAFGPAIVFRLLVLWALLLGGWWIWAQLAAASATSATADRLLRRLPWVGKVRSHWVLGRFCQVFHSALLAAISISESLRMAGGSSQSAVTQAGAESAAAAVESGDTLAKAMAQTTAWPKVFSDSVHAAEAAGRLDVEMERWAKSETEFAIAAQRHVAEILPKVLYFFVVAYVGWSIIGFFASYFGQISRIGKGF